MAIKFFGENRLTQLLTLLKSKFDALSARIKQPDWNQTDTTADDYIKNKPTIPSGGVTGVKGNAESTYRSGDVNLTAANVGALPDATVPINKGGTGATTAVNAILNLFGSDSKYRMKYVSSGESIGSITSPKDGLAIWQDNDESAGIILTGDGVYIFAPPDEDALIFINEDEDSKGWSIDGEGSLKDSNGNEIYIRSGSNSADYPTGFWGKLNSQPWGNQDGTFVTGWDGPSNADIAFRNNGGQLNVIIDGRYYQNEGQYKVLDESTGVKKSGDTMTGSLTFANGTWNVVGDDCAIGDINVAGTLGVKGQNGTTRIRLVQYGGSNYGDIYFDGSVLTFQVNGGNTSPRVDSNGYMYAFYLNASCGDESAYLSSDSHYIIYALGDGYFRKATLSKLKDLILGWTYRGNTGAAPNTITISSSGIHEILIDWCYDGIPSGSYHLPVDYIMNRKSSITIYWGGQGHKSDSVGEIYRSGSNIRINNLGDYDFYVYTR